MAGRGEDNIGLDLNDDDDILFNDDSFLAAIANVEAQHIGRMTNFLSSNGPKISGAYMYGNGAPDNNNIAGKRSAYWEGQNNIHGSSGQLPRGGENGSSFGNSSEDEHRKRIRTEDEMQSSWPASSLGQGNEARLASAGQSESQQPEGEYMAALRGSNSELWQSSAGVGRGKGTTAAGLPNRAGTSDGSSFNKGGSSGNCFKCGLPGHWSKDCAGGKASSSPTKRAGGEAQGGPVAAERLCACGAGACSVFTANTEKNMGRNFYKCPLRKDEGQCTFFEWCDAGGQSVPTERGANFQDSTNQQSQLQCKCGGGPCTVLTARTEKNMGRQFYKCPRPQSCTFFQWCDEASRDVGGNSSTTPTRATSFSGNPAASPLPPRSVGCYNCGQAGHWSKDCPNPQAQNSQGRNTGKPTGSASGYSSDWTCHNCGNPGHWAQNCPSPSARRY